MSAHDPKWEQEAQGLSVSGWLEFAIIILGGGYAIWWGTERAWGKFSIGTWQMISMVHPVFELSLARPRACSSFVCHV